MVSSQAGPGPTIHSLLPYTGWLFFVFLLIWISQQFFGKILQDLGGRFSVLFARSMGQRTLGRRILKKYSSAVSKNYGEHALGFRSEGTVNVAEVYVPLQYVDSEGYRQGVDEAIHDADRTVILGEPGAGKSLLLKHLLTSWANGSPSNGHRIPVLVELHRCNDSGVSLKDLIGNEFERNGVRGRQASVERALADGDLLVLFDGLDEVARDHHTRVVQAIKDFVATWESCRYLMTCRVAVYTGQLSPVFSSSVSITDFDDAGIRSLLAKWPGLDAAEADRFFTGLADNPQLMRLAGSPLLLTMMIYLHTQVYAKAGRTLPGSRSAFYDMAVNHLLRRDRELARNDALSIYEGSDKLAVLQRVALVLQQNPGDLPDRRSIEKSQLVEIVRQVSTRLNLRPDDDVIPLIDEIVKRSQLLVELGGQSARYVFRHLTLQEFLAATQLQNDQTQLMAGYRTDHDGWRETMRLWCGVTSLDCSAVVEEIFNGDEQEKVLALQCVAEAANIDPVLAERVVAHFIDLIRVDVPDPAIASALGAVASDERPRARAVLAQLQDVFESDQPGAGSAARALAATRLPMAAEVLGRRIAGDSRARSALRTMGEQAVPVLARAAAAGDVRSVDDLGEIGTASAAVALTELIWTDSDVAVRAAWWIAGLVRRPEVEVGLRGARPQIQRHYEFTAFDFVWPRRPGEMATLALIMGRVARLLRHDVSDHAPSSITIDHRLVVPLVFLDSVEGTSAQSNGGGADSTEADTEAEAIARAEVLLGSFTRISGIVDLQEMVEVIIRCSRSDADRAVQAITELVAALPEPRQRLFVHAPPAVQYAMLQDGVILRNVRRKLTMQNWRDAAVPVSSSEGLWSALRVALSVVALVATGAAGYLFVGPRFGADVAGPPWFGIASGIACAIMVVTLAGVLISSAAQRFSNSILDFLEDLMDVVDYPVTGWVVVGAGLICAGSAILTLQHQVGTLAAIGVLVVIVLLLSGIAGMAERQQRRVANPFRRYLNKTEAELMRDSGHRAFRLAPPL